MLQWLAWALAWLVILGTVLSFIPHPHWLFRMFDFPRLHLAVAAAVAIGIYSWLGYADRWWLDAPVLLILSVGLIFHLLRIVPYTRLWRTEAKAIEPDGGTCEIGGGRRIRLVITNVQMENEQFDRWHDVIAAADPDVLVAVETDAKWAESIRRLQTRLPYIAEQVQDNYYGMMVLSRLRLSDTRIAFLVQDDVPSIHTRVHLGDGSHVRLIAVHPRPPEPIRNQDSGPRDAELVHVGRVVSQSKHPHIVAGDLNDVAWSHNTRLFQRVSGMLDPRRGRAMINSYNARNPLVRFPLDHVFISEAFGLGEIRRLDAVGSDHFPVLIELCYQPDQADGHDAPQPTRLHRVEAERKIERPE
jgi:endonuclease/exonuclease/phosphatase (EEP) superfamily protein YafD